MQIATSAIVKISMTAEKTEDDIKLLDPGEDIKPRVTKDAVPDLVEKLYGLKVNHIKELPSYDDLNFYITTSENASNEHISETNADGYVFKILNSLQSSTPMLIEAQHSLKKLVREHGIPTQVPVCNKQGRNFSIESFPLKDGSEASYLIRLVTFIPGKTFVNTPYVPSTFINIGKFLGRLHKATKDFNHPFYDTYNTVWSLAEVSKIRNFLFAVKEEQDKHVVEQVLDSFDEEVVPKYDLFRKGVIHGDVNEQNLVMQEVPNQEAVAANQRVGDVACILDFFDVTFSFPVFDVGICIMYVSLDAPEDIQLDVGGYLLHGYKDYITLNEAELESLKVIVCARLCQSLVYGAHGFMLDPSNTYLITTQKRGWQFLHRLWEVSKEDLYKRWADIKLSKQ